SPDGRLLASFGVPAGNMRFWETGTWQPYGPFQPDWGNMVFSPRSGLWATGSGDGVVRLWRVPTPPGRLPGIAPPPLGPLGARLNERGTAEAIPWQEWQKLRAELRQSTAWPAIAAEQARATAAEARAEREAQEQLTRAALSEVVSSSAGEVRLEWRPIPDA